MYAEGTNRTEGWEGPKTALNTVEERTAKVQKPVGSLAPTDPSRT